nr:MAG TPA: hypothetical protein [Bacteriophage sp.]
MRKTNTDRIAFILCRFYSIVFKYIILSIFFLFRSGFSFNSKNRFP